MKLVADKLATWPTGVIIQKISYDYYQADTVATADIQTAIATVADQALPGDKLIFYYSGHGIGGDAIEDYLRPMENDRLQDETLASFLANPKLSQVSKVVFLDSCHAGGFWADDNGFPLDRDLNHLNNIALLAAAPENGSAVYPRAGNGYSPFTAELVRQLTPNATFESIWTGVTINSQYRNLVEGFLKDEGFGTVVYEPIAYASADFDRNARLDGSLAPAVPEPSSLIMFGIGSAVLAVRVFRRRQPLPLKD